MNFLKRVWRWACQSNRIEELQHRVNFLEDTVADWEYYKEEYLSDILRSPKKHVTITEQTTNKGEIK